MAPFRVVPRWREEGERHRGDIRLGDGPAGPDGQCGRLPSGRRSWPVPLHLAEEEELVDLAEGPVRPRRPGCRRGRPSGWPPLQAPCPSEERAGRSPACASPSGVSGWRRARRCRWPTQTRPRRPPRGPARTSRRETIVPDPRVPRRACPAMVHLCRPVPCRWAFCPCCWSIRRPPIRMDSDSSIVIGSIGRRMFVPGPAPGDDPSVPCRLVLAAGVSRSDPVTCPGRLADVRVRTFELRLIAVGPDWRAGRWPPASCCSAIGPAARSTSRSGSRPLVPDRDRPRRARLAARDARVSARSRRWSGWGSGRCCCSCPRSSTSPTSSCSGGAQTLLPSVEAAYPWALALLGTSLFAGFGIARRLLGETAMRRRRLVRGIVVATRPRRRARASLFTAVAMANELALRDRPTPSSRFGPTDTRATSRRPATRPLSVGDTARIELHLDRRPRRPLDRQRRPRRRPHRRRLPLARLRGDVAASWASTARRGSATDAWIREPFGGWRRATRT